VLVSAANRAADRATAERAGADVYLGKPFPLAELVAAVDELVAPGRDEFRPAVSSEAP
jgi:DNA-binding response OmpR family regulator